jgi:hypothetical protein
MIPGFASPEAPTEFSPGLSAGSESAWMMGDGHLDGQSGSLSHAQTVAVKWKLPFVGRKPCVAVWATLGREIGERWLLYYLRKCSPGQQAALLPELRLYPAPAGAFPAISNFWPGDRMRQSRSMEPLAVIPVSTFQHGSRGPSITTPRSSAALRKFLGAQALLRCRPFIFCRVNLTQLLDPASRFPLPTVTRSHWQRGVSSRRGRSPRPRAGGMLRSAKSRRCGLRATTFFSFFASACLPNSLFCFFSSSPLPRLYNFIPNTLEPPSCSQHSSPPRSSHLLTFDPSRATTYLPVSTRQGRPRSNGLIRWQSR